MNPTFQKDDICKWINNLLISDFPKALQIEITTKCNLNCIMCLRFYQKIPETNMSFESFKNIINKFPKLKAVDLTGGGENFLNEDFFKIIEYAKSKKIFVSFFSNFFFIDKKNTEELISLKVDEITASLDAAKKETYEKIRIGSNFEIVTNNIYNFFQIKKQKNIFLPKINFNYTINKYNIEEVVKYVDLVHFLTEKQKTSISFNNTAVWQKGENKDLYLPDGIPKDIFKNLLERSKKFKIPIVWASNVFNQKPRVNKCIKYLKPLIRVNGDFLPCCVTQKKYKDFADNNILKEGAQEIIFNKEYVKFRQMIKEDKIHPWCKNCSYYETNY